MESKIAQKALDIAINNKFIKGLSLILGVGTAGTIGSYISLSSFLQIFVIAVLSGIFVVLYGFIFFSIILIYLYISKISKNISNIDSNSNILNKIFNLKILILIPCTLILVSFCPKAFATDWVQISDIWFVDLDSCECNKDTAQIWSRVNVSKKHIKTKNNKKVTWIMYSDTFYKDKNIHLTKAEILYDKNFNALEDNQYPFGKDISEFPSNCPLETIKDIAFLTPQQIRDIKQMQKNGIIKMFTPYIKIENQNNFINNEEDKKISESKKLIEDFNPNKFTIPKVGLLVFTELTDETSHSRVMATVPVGTTITILDDIGKWSNISWYSNNESKYKYGWVGKNSVYSAKFSAKGDSETAIMYINDDLAEALDVIAKSENNSKKILNYITNGNFDFAIKEATNQISKILSILHDVNNYNKVNNRLLLGNFYLLRSYAYLLKCDYIQALRDIDEAIYYDNNNIHSLYLIKGNIYKEQGYYSKAKNCYIKEKTRNTTKENEALKIELNRLIKDMDNLIMQAQ